jgi:ABC-type transport system involved in cytochrome bd biosynthesis fused ATPase/permease subunit
MVKTLVGFELFPILTLCVSIIAVILTYVDMRKRLSQEQEFSKSMANLINTLREELKLFRKKSSTSDDIERQKLLFKKEQQQWNQFKDIAKAIGWFMEQAENEEDEEEY